MCYIVRACVICRNIPRAWRQAEVTFKLSPRKKAILRLKHVINQSVVFLAITSQKVVDRFIRDEVMRIIPLRRN
jgi:hypothetical protein